MSDAVVEETRTEVSVEEVTERRYRCAVCDMVYNPDHIISIGLDRDRVDTSDGMFTDSAQPRAERYICEHCVDGLFDYEPDGDSTFSESQTPTAVGPIDKLAALGTVTIFVSIAVAGASLVVATTGGQMAIVPAMVIPAAVTFVLGVWL